MGCRFSVNSWIGLLELRLTFLDECLVSRTIVGMLHTHRLGLCFALECDFEIHIELPVQQLFSFREGASWSSCLSFSYFIGSRCQFVARHHPIVQADLFSLVS